MNEEIKKTVELWFQSAKQGNKKALDKLIDLAQQGNEKAKDRLYNIYYYGIGVKADTEKALYWKNK